MDHTLALVAAGFGIVLGVVFGTGLLVPTPGNAVYGALNPRRIGDPHQRRFAVSM
jgi:hypothetical protein